MSKTHPTRRSIRPILALTMACAALVVASLGARAVTSADQGELAEHFEAIKQSTLSELPAGATLTTQQEIAALYQAYDELRPSDPEALRKLNEEFEKEFAKIGFVAVPDPGILTDDSQDHEYVPDLGIDESGEDLPFFKVSNSWTTDAGSDYVTVYAGATKDSPDEGAVQIFVNGEPSGVPIPAKGLGPLTIAAADGTRLKLIDNDGRSVLFDLESRAFA